MERRIHRVRQIVAAMHRRTECARDAEKEREESEGGVGLAQAFVDGGEDCGSETSEHEEEAAEEDVLKNDERDRVQEAGGSGETLEGGGSRRR